MQPFTQITAAANWGKRVALLALQLFLLTLLLHRFASLPTPVAIKLFGLSVLGAVIAILLGVAALVRIWREGAGGTGRAVLALLAAGVVIAGPAWSLPNLLFLPKANDVTTDPHTPPAFAKLAHAHRQGGDGLPVLGNDRASSSQAYTDLQPLLIARPAEDVFALAREAAANLGWKIVSEVPPKDGQPGVIEAVDRSLFFGFTSDIVIRVRGGNRNARVDVRSASRHEAHDLGRNAGHIRDLLSEVQTVIARLERTEKIERMARLRAERERLAKRREELARKSQGYDTLTHRWRQPRSRSRTSEERRKRRYGTTRELRRFWERMAN